jgi:outer membrane protein OmpA-like peptidoglycan-associated protein
MKSCCFILLLIVCCHTIRSQQATDTLLIHFDFSQSLITPQATALLDSFLQVNSPAALKQVTLHGHCDFIGSHAYNDSLSQQRVRAAKAYLAGKGIAPALFGDEAGFGKRKPLTLATTNEARAVNRRVEIVFVKQDIPQAEPPKKEPVVTTSNPTLSDIIKDTATKTGSKLVLPNLYFEPGQHFLLEQSYPILRELLKAMQDNEGLQIEIQGHICCLSGGIDGYDWSLGTNDLSVQRAKAIYNFLIKEGIPASRMSYKGFGSAQKLFPEERSQIEMTKNRRVEIKIVSK